MPEPTDQPSTDVDVAARRRAAAARLVQQMTSSDWVDGDDLRDRAASDHSRSAEAQERPPHY